MGRAAELALLDGGVDALLAGDGRLFLLAGDPGIGKTRLADHLAARAAERGAAVAWGGAWDGGGAPAYWPWIQILRTLRPRIPPPDERLRRDLGVLWDAANADERAGADLEMERFRHFDALRAVLQAAAGRGPVVLVIDDLHAADRGSLLALHFLARQLRALPLLILATHRDPTEPELGELIARIAREARVLRLSPFTEEEIRELLSDFDPVSGELASELLRATGGNPLFVDETLRLVRAGERVADVGAGAGAVIRERLDRIEPELRALLEAAAVLGRELRLAMLAEVLGSSLGDLERRLRSQQLFGIVARTGPGLLGFRHGLFREELYRALPPPRRRALHLAAGRTLAAEPTEPAESVARHLLAAQPEGDASVAATWALSAAEIDMGALAFDRAVELFEGAVAALDRLPEDRPRRVDVRLRLAEALEKAGATERSRAVCREAAAEAREIGDGPRLARAALCYGARIRIAFVDRTLIRLLEEALLLLGDREPSLRARALARLAAAEQPAPDPDLPVERARQAIELARTLGDPETTVATLHYAGSALADYAPAEERRALAEELIAQALGRGELALAQQGYARTAVDSIELCDFAGADFAIEAHERLGRALGHPRWRWRGAVMRSMRALIDGRWEASEAAREEAAAHARQADDPNTTPTLALHAVGAFRAREGGRPEDVLAALGSSLDALPDGAEIGATLRAIVSGRVGDPEPARRFLSAFRLVPGIARDPMGIAVISDVVVCAGDPRWAAEVLRAAEAFRGRALSWGLFGVIWEGPAEQWIGGLALVLERWQEAADALDAALSRAETLGARPLAARLREQLARATAALGEPEQAAALLDVAAEQAGALGMEHLSARIEHTRRGLAPRRAGSKRPAPAALPSLSREGDVWSIGWDDRVIRLRHSRALEILDRLVQHAGRELHVLDLAGGPGPIDGGDAGALIDAEAAKAYRRRIAELEEELHQAEEWADGGRCERLGAELEFLKEELGRSLGLGGRPRRAAGATERARVNVTKRIKGVIKKIAGADPDLGAHLEKSIKTGAYVSYRPGHGP